MTTKEATIGLSIEGAFESYVCDLTYEVKSQKKSPRTLAAYTKSIEQMVSFFKAKGMPLHVEGITREHVQEFMSDQLNHLAPATAALRYRCASLFFDWLVAEDEIKANPMEKLKSPKIPLKLAPVLANDQLGALIAVCEKDKSFEGIRDTAIVRTFLDSGLRVGELTSVTLEAVDLKGHRLFVTGKGNKPRMASIGAKTAKALDRYIRARAKHRLAADYGALWLGRKGPLHVYSVEQVIKRRGRQAGIEGLHPHLLRHTWAHLYQAAGGNETSLMKLAGWSSSQMVQRYGASAAAERAHAEHQRLRIADQF